MTTDHRGDDDRIHPDDRFIPAFTAEEETEYRELRRIRQEIADALAKLPDEQADWLEAQIGWRAYFEIGMVHARLCRVFPHLSDVLTYLCFPWRVNLPNHLEPDGKPERFWESGDAMDERYGGEAQRRYAGRKHRTDAPDAEA